MLNDVTKSALATRLVHAGEEENPLGSVAFPVFDTASFVHDDKAARDSVRANLQDSWFYSGVNNPTVAALERKVASIESAPSALAFNAGMAAITTAVLATCRGGHVIVSDKLFLVTAKWFREDLPAFGCDVSIVDFLDIEQVRDAFRPDTRALFFEVFSNPLLAVVDLEQVIELARSRDALTIVDNTFASPALFRPYELGADLVVHSATKYMSGHGRVRAGVLAGSTPLIRSIAELRSRMGAIVTPHNAAGILDGLHTLDLRVTRASKTAEELVRIADAHAATEEVHYPGLPTNPGHDVATRLTGGRYGGMFSFSLHDPAKKADVYDAFRLIRRATSLGDSVSLVDAVDESDVLRISTGIEDPDDLAADLETALDAAL